MKLRRVFALVPDCHVPGWRYADVWARHFYAGLEQAGVEVIRPRHVDFGWARPPQTHDPARSADARTRTSEALLAQITGAAGGPPQAVLSCCFSHDVEPDLVDRVRAAGIPWVNFFCDSLYAFDLVSALAARTSLNWFVESAAEERYRKLGVPCLRAPYALNPAALPDASCVTPEIPLLFAGSAHRRRIRTAALLRLAGADLRVSGWGWREALDPAPSPHRESTNPFTGLAWAAARALLGAQTGGFLDDAAFLAQLRRTVVVLGLNEGGDDKAAQSYLKLRDVEFPGMGCCCLTQHHADLEGVFTLGKEIFTFRSPWEGARLAKDLARHPAECREIGRRARTRVLAEHTCTARLPAIEARL